MGRSRADQGEEEAQAKRVTGGEFDMEAVGRTARGGREGGPDSKETEEE